MLRSWNLGKLFGIPLYIHSTFVLLPAWVLLHAALAGGLNGPTAVFLLTCLAALTACIVLHELGHALTARLFGIGTRDITLYPIGGVARLERMSERPGEELAIAVAGPAVNVGIVGLLLPVLLLLAPSVGGLGPDLLTIDPAAGLGVALAKFLLWLWLTNILLVVFNLVPAFPMDGGRVLRALLSAALGHLRGTEIAVRVGVVMAVLLAVFGVIVGNPFLLLIALFVCWGGQQELYAVRYREARRQAALAPADVLPAGPAWGAPEPAPAAPGFSGVLWDSHYGVWVHWRNGRPVAYWGPAE
jgi:Zn-dependent protease